MCIRYTALHSRWYQQCESGYHSFLECVCTHGFFKSANECHQSILLPWRDLSQLNEAQRTPYSRTALPQRERWANTELSEEAATESSLFDFVNQWKAYGEQISAGLAEWGNPEVFAEDEIKSWRDIRASHRVKVAQPSLSVCQLDTTLPQVEELVLTRWVGRPYMMPEARQTHKCHISCYLSKRRSLPPVTQSHLMFLKWTQSMTEVTLRFLNMMSDFTADVQCELFIDLALCFKLLWEHLLFVLC